MPRFNFTEINLTDAADIRTIMENFNKIEESGITGDEVDSKISASAQSINSATDTKLANYTTTANLKPLAKVNYSYGNAAPSGGANGDLYDQYF